MDEIAISAIAAAVAVVGAAFATAWAQGRIGTAGAGVLAEKPEMLGGIIVLVAIPETLVIMGFAIAALLLLT
jgi:V/A-type H+-transporting ATPase subunit K